MSIEPMFLIVLDRADTEELNAVQKIVKENARGWWHRFTNVWLAGGGDSAVYWRDLIKPALKPGASSVMVLLLPAPADRRWAMFGSEAKDRAAWIHKNYG